LKNPARKGEELLGNPQNEHLADSREIEAGKGTIKLGLQAPGPKIRKGETTISEHQEKKW